MRKTLIVMALGLLAVGQVRAQGDQDGESREARRAELIQKSGERLAKSFGLENAARDSFLAIYTQYQTEMFATNEPHARREAGQAQEADGKKELTDEQATQRMAENLQRQQRQVEQLQKRIDIQTRYQERFLKVLTPVQALKAMFPQRRQAPSGARKGEASSDSPRGEGSFRGGPRHFPQGGEPF